MNDKVIIDYYVATRTDIRSLERSVNFYISKGFQPFGNLLVVNNCFHQPLVKYKEKETIQ